LKRGISMDKLPICICTVFILLFISCIFTHAQEYEISNNKISVCLDTDTSLIKVTTANRVWHQRKPASMSAFTYNNVQISGNSITGNISRSKDKYSFVITLAPDEGEFRFSLTFVSTTNPNGKSNNWVGIPYPFVGEKHQDTLVLPYREGVGIPVEDLYLWDGNAPSNGKISTDYYALYAGHNFNQPWSGLTDNKNSMLQIVETPFDAAIQLREFEGSLCATNIWEHSWGDFTYTRSLRYVFQEQGGYVGMCERYRDIAQDEGLIVTLQEKVKENPVIDMIVGAPAFYYQDLNTNPSHAVSVAQTLVDAGVERCIFYGGSARFNKMSAAEIETIKNMGYAASRYSIFEDFVASGDENKIAGGMNPNHFPVPVEHAKLKADGERLRLFSVPTVDGGTYLTYNLTEALQLDYAKTLVPPDQDEKGYVARFIDTTAAQALYEDYDPNHPMTRSEAQTYRAELLQWHRDLGIAVGSEGGWSCFVPYADYFEGARSFLPLTTYEGNESAIFNMYKEGALPQYEKEELLKAPEYILPIWQLVFGDCVQTHTRWNMGTAKFFDKEWLKTHELYCILMGQPAMVAVLSAFWQSDELVRDTITAHMARIYTANEKVRYARMINHEILTADKKVQRADFDNNISIIVTFGDKDYYSEELELNVRGWGYRIFDSAKAPFGEQKETTVPYAAVNVLFETDFNNDDIGKKAIYFGTVSAPGAGDAGSAVENGNCITELGEYSTIRVADGSEANAPGKVLKFATTGDITNRTAIRTCNAYITAIDSNVTENGLIGVISYKIKTNFAQLDPVTQNQRNGTDVFQMNFNNGNNGAFTGQIMLQFRRNGVVSPLNQTPAPSSCTYTPGEWTGVTVVLRKETAGKFFDVYINGKMISKNNPTISGLSNFQMMFALNSAQADIVYIDDVLIYNCKTGDAQTEGMLMDVSVHSFSEPAFYLYDLDKKNVFDVVIRNLDRQPKITPSDVCAVVAQYDENGNLISISNTTIQNPDYKSDTKIKFGLSTFTSKVKCFIWDFDCLRPLCKNIIIE